MPRASLSFGPGRELYTRYNFGQSRTAVMFGGTPLEVRQWTPWALVNLDQRIASWRGTPKYKGDFIHTTSVVYYKGQAYGNSDAGTYANWSFMYGVRSHLTKSDDYAVYYAPHNDGYSDDPRNSTWNIGGHLTLARYMSEYNYLSHHIRKKMAAPIVNMGLIVGESLMTKRAFEKIAVDLLHVLRFVKHGDVLGAVKVAFGNTNINAIANRSTTGLLKRRVKTRTGKQWVFYGKSGVGRTKSELRAMHPSGRWLEYSFGIAPVIQDVQDLASLHAGTFDVPIFRFAKSSLFTKGEVEGKLRMVAKVTLTDPLARYRQQLGTHATQVYALAWELVPLSWLIDYAIDIGGMLEYLSSTVGLTYKDACWSVKLTGKDLICRGGSTYTSWSCLNRFDYYERNLLATIPIPTHPKLLKVLNSGTQQANLFAFIIQAFSGHADKRISNLG